MTTSEPGRLPTPKPTPRPGPPRPVPRPGRPAPTVAAPPTSDPHRFGRVDPDGTVWLITSAGERVIGSWQAGDTEAAFAHFGRRFDDLHTEVALMERRLASGTGDARKIKSAAAALAESLPTAAVLGDVDALAARLATIVEHADAARAGRARPARRAPRRADRPQGGAGRRGRGHRQPTRRSGRPPATGCARSSTSGARSPGWTARPTTRCGSGTRRPARRSTGAAGRISPNWTASGSAPARPRRRCASAPRSCPTPPTGARPVRRSATC